MIICWMDADLIVRNLDDNTEFNIMAESKYSPDYDELQAKPGAMDSLYDESKIAGGDG